MLIIIAFFGTLLGDPTVLMYFALYFIAVACVVFTMLERIFVLRVILFVTNLARGNKNTESSVHGDGNEIDAHDNHGDAMTPIIQVSEIEETI